MAATTPEIQIMTIRNGGHFENAIYFNILTINFCVNFNYDRTVNQLEIKKFEMSVYFEKAAILKLAKFDQIYLHSSQSYHSHFQAAVNLAQTCLLLV